jgi:hypothetical protein
MYNTKILLREEIALNDKKMLLSEHSLMMIQNSSYVKNVLGIDTTLNENYPLGIRKLIIEQQIIIENLLDSINGYLGNLVQKGKEKSLNFIKSVKNLKELAILFKDILLDPELMNEAIKNVKKSLTEQLNNFKNNINKILTNTKVTIQNFTDKLQTFLNNVLTYSNDVLNKDGWVPFLTMLGLAVLLTWVNRKWLEVILNNITEGLKKIDGVVNLFNSLKDLIKTAVSNLGIENIFAWFTSLGTETSGIGIIFTISEIILIISEILMPTVQTITTRFNLQKT